MSETLLRLPRKRAQERRLGHFWQVKLSLLVDGATTAEDADEIAARLGGYPEVRLDGVEQNLLAGTVTIAVTLPAFDAVHAVDRAAHVARECAIASDRSLPAVVRVSGGPGRPARPN